MEAKPTSTNAAKVQPSTTERTVVFDYLQKNQTETRPRGGGRPQGDFQDREQRPRRGGRGGRGGYDRERNNENG